MKLRQLPQLCNYVVVFALLFLTLFPFYLLAITSFKHEDQIIHHFWVPTLPFHAGNYAGALLQIWPFILNSVIITAGIILCVLINSSLAGYSFARFQFFGKELLFYLIIMLMMVPSFLLLIPQFILFKNMGLINTYWAQIFGPMAGSSALAVMLMRTFFEGVSTSLMESAEIEGAGEFRIFAQIVIPLSLPIISTVAIVNALLGWNNYIWPLVITSGEKVRPVILALDQIRGPIDQVDGLKFAGFVIASIPLLLLFIFATKPFVSGITAGAVKG